MPPFRMLPIYLFIACANATVHMEFRGQAEGFWVLGIELELSDLLASTFIHWVETSITQVSEMLCGVSTSCCCFLSSWKQQSA